MLRRAAAIKTLDMWQIFGGIIWMAVRVAIRHSQQEKSFSNLSAAYMQVVRY
jgi:hypothetical protein